MARRQILRFGGPDSHPKLRRAGVDRDCIAAILDYGPRERDLVIDGAVRCLIAAEGLEVPPDFELDQLIFRNVLYRMVGPIRGPRPNGIPIFYDTPVLYDTTLPEEESEEASEVSA